MHGKAASTAIRLLAPPLVIAWVAASGGEAFADTCSSLRAQLAALSRQDQASAKAGSAGELAKLQTQAKWGGCISGGRGFFVAKRSPDCPRILERIAELQRGTVRRSAPVNPAARARILSALQRNGCNAAPSREAKTRETGPPRYGSYRTVCVRTCDGYYFPLGYSTRQSLLKVEEAACKSMYYGADAALYVYRTSGEVKEARSLTGERYSEKPFAFVYRDSFDARCVAEIREGLAGLAKVLPPPKIAVRVARAASEGKPVVDPSMPLPAQRPARPAEDPETRTNGAGDFGVATEAPSMVVADAAIRKLGPSYYYEQPPDPAPFVRSFVDNRVPYTFTLIDAAQAGEPPPTDPIN